MSQNSESSVLLSVVLLKAYLDSVETSHPQAFWNLLEQAQRKLSEPRQKRSLGQKCRELLRRRS